jgi:hypothetical protein
MPVQDEAVGDVLELDIVPSTDHQRFSTTIDNATYTFEVRWNVDDESFYLDVYEVDGTAIMLGMRIVLGAFLGRTKDHPLFRRGVLMAYDISGDKREATYDDLGTRVVIRWVPVQTLVKLTRAAALAFEAS